MRHIGLLNRVAALGLALSFVASPALAATITGTWQQVDDENNEIRSLVQITEQNSVFEGKIIKLFPHADETQAPICDQCSGNKKNAPYLGLKIIENIRKTADGYAGGIITDPESGTEYKLKLTPSDDGATLQIRGYIGLEMMGRTQVWLRQK